VLNKSKDDSIFENSTIQAVIYFKWEMYTKGYYRAQFKWFIFFILCFILSNHLKWPVLQTIALIGGALAQFKLMEHERASLRQQGHDKYWKDIWNWIDTILPVFYLSYFIAVTTFYIFIVEAFNPER
jgi:hypothetical protein